jgi:hypothetical protein
MEKALFQLPEEHHKELLSDPYQSTLVCIDREDTYGNHAMFYGVARDVIMTSEGNYTIELFKMTGEPVDKGD